ncbi:MAG: adenylate/guanylate cyclase domain-containing protein [Bacteroidota bacterium]
MSDYKRKLAAILFADIVGYTALMQKDEQQASQLLRHFQQQLEGKVEAHNGQIVNFYGDGALCTFQIPVEAVRCAMDLQTTFLAEPNVPVRIGIHSGTVTYEGDKIFGDAVNITARIESMGIAGGVLLSKKVRDEVKNNPDLEPKSLGRFEFKHVEEPIEVFALANGDLIVPNKKALRNLAKAKRKKRPKKTKVEKRSNLLIIFVALLITGFGIVWGINSNTSGDSKLVSIRSSSGTAPLPKAIREKKAAVMVFEDQTLSEDLSAYGKMISDWLTQGLMEVSSGGVVSAANVQQNIALAGVGNTASSEFAEATDAEVIVQGRYYLRNDKIIIQANIVDAENGEVIHALERIEGHQKDAMKLLDDLTQEVLGYWVLSGRKRFEKKVPRFEAYQTYIQYPEHWMLNDEKTEALLLKAFELDTSFYDPLLKMIVMYNNQDRIVARDSLIEYIETNNFQFTDYEQLRFNALRAEAQGQLLKAAEFYNKTITSYDMHRDMAAQNYNYANHPSKAIETLEGSNRIRLNDIDDKFVGQWDLSILLHSYFEAAQYKKILTVLDTVLNSPYNVIKDPRIAIFHIRALIHLDNLISAKEYLYFYLDPSNAKIDFPRRNMKKHILETFCDELYLLDKPTLAQYYDLLTEKDQLMRLYFYQQDYKKCLLEIQKRINDKELPNSKHSKAMQAFCLAKMGETEAAMKLLEEVKIPDPNARWKGASYYSSACIYTALDNKKEAVSALGLAYDKGFPFFGNTYDKDIFLKDLLGEPAFQDLVKARG